MARRGKKKSTTVSVDFTGVEASGSVAEGRQKAEVAEVELKESESGNQYLNWRFKCKGGSVWHTTSLLPQSLWNLRNLLEAMGQEVAEEEVDLDLSEYTGESLGVEIEHETFEGKKKGVIVDMFPLDQLDGSDEDDDPDEEEPDDEGEEELTYEEVQDSNAAQLEDIVEEYELGKVPARTKKSLPKYRDWVCSQLELEPSDEDDPDEDVELKKGMDVTFEDDGEDVSGTILKLNKKEGFAVVDVDGDEWEIELEDLTPA